ncbi:hypothetical protein NPX13_g10010 [Xylaria arbuscula]|uniref:Uncharacterized protein n=1 Tax=Xylaria arbuscula TaxID=114810 RepID=A0A9W8TIB8_9PEZI|nr:hypothetical protein NPX13_g10010 [Xylaria arbuscula]
MTPRSPRRFATADLPYAAARRAVPDALAPPKDSRQWTGGLKLSTEKPPCPEAPPKHPRLVAPDPPKLVPTAPKLLQPYPLAAPSSALAPLIHALSGTQLQGLDAVLGDLGSLVARYLVPWSALG